MNLAPLLAELAGLNALPNGLLQSAQQSRLETVRSALALAQHIVPGASDDLPRIRISVGQGVVEGRVLAGCRGSLQFRISGGASETSSTVALVHFTDGRPPLAIRGDIRPGPSSGYWVLEASDGSLVRGASICEQPESLRAEPTLALAL